MEDAGPPAVPRPWTDADRLAGVLAGWRDRLAGRALFAVTAGPAWVRLHLEGEAREGILLSSEPGALLAVLCAGRLPESLNRALPARRDHPLRGLLDGARLDGLGLLPTDRVAAFRLVKAGEPPRVLLHRLFGARGNTVLLDHEARIVWAARRPPHRSLAALPPPETWSGGAAVADDLSAPALDHLAAVLADRTLAGHAAALGRRLRAAERLAANLETDLAAAGRGDELRRRAEALAAHLHELRPGQAEVTVDDPRGGEPLVLALDPARSPAANLEAAFRRARKAEKGRDLIAARLDDARAEAARLREALAGADALSAGPAADRLAAAQAWRDRTADLLPTARPGRSPHAADEPARPFRRYRIDGRWEVWIGRSSAENDELTHRASHGRDLWLHAQGVPGSHVILRTGGHPERVPRAVLEKAAGLAALHSKARHSQLVPVVWTERRYVRKPRRAAAGTAVTQQAQSLFAEPRVAAGVEPD